MVRPAGMAVGTAAIVLSCLLAAPAGAASCAESTERERFELAEVVVDGVFQPGDGEPGGTLYSPATLRVHRWHKGPGGETVRVATLTTRLPDGSFMGSSGDPAPKAGEAWRLYGRLDERGVLRTLCAGAVRLASLDEPLPFTGAQPLLTAGLAAAAAGLGGQRWSRRRRC